MRRSGFTLIELVFVIVVLGILAAVAVPRLSGVQDDAVVAAEEAGVGSIRAGIASVKAKIALASGETVNIPVVKNDGTAATCVITKTASDATGVTSGNPNGISLTSDYDKPSYTAENQPYTLGLVLDDPTNRTKWKTKAEGTNTKFVGPASSDLAGTSGAKYNKDGSWLYSPATGTVLYKNAIPYSNN